MRYHYKLKTDKGLLKNILCIFTALAVCITFTWPGFVFADPEDEPDDSAAVESVAEDEQTLTYEDDDIKATVTENEPGALGEGARLEVRHVDPAGPENPLSIASIEVMQR